MNELNLIMVISVIFGIILFLYIVTIIYHAFLPKAGGGEVKKGESTDYTIDSLNKKK